jgi:hypothetical protein
MMRDLFDVTIPGVPEGWYETLMCDIQWDITAPISVYDANYQPRNTVKPEIKYYSLTPKDWREVKRLPRALYVRYPLDKGITPDYMTRVVEDHYGWYISGATWASAMRETWNVAARDADAHGVKTAWIRKGVLVWR